MKKILFLILFAVGCQDYNSNSSDESIYGEIKLPPDASPEFQASYRILKTRCFACHSEWSSYKTNSQWIDAGLVFKNDPDNSAIIYRLKNFSPPGDMPPGGNPAIPDGEYQSLRTWITTIP